VGRQSSGQSGAHDNIQREYTPHFNVYGIDEAKSSRSKTSDWALINGLLDNAEENDE